MTTIAILGASNPEMQDIEDLLTKNGVQFVYAMNNGERVQLGTAYRTDGLSRDIPSGAEIWAIKCDGPAIDALYNSGHEVFYLDHHKFCPNEGYGQTWAAIMAMMRSRRKYKIVLQYGRGPDVYEWESYIEAENIFRAAEVIRPEVEANNLHVIEISEYED